MEMAKRIKERRILIGLTQEELGEKLGLQKSAIAKYENGRVENIKRSIIANMAKILECSPAYLMGWEDEPLPDAPEHTYPLNSKEELLLTDFRTLNEQGQDYILQTMDMVKDKYKKSDFLSDLEEIV
ncbi:MAG: helix-turn-helix domain-containing protein [Lachnospiraceae bacterium]|nr:helix-turn-helix domain-containing protein [Lachnospiraceae bacterium]